MRIQSTYLANFIKVTNTVQQIQQFKLYCSFFQVNMQSRPEYSVHLTFNESNFVQLSRKYFKSFSNECQLPSRYLN